MSEDHWSQAASSGSHECPSKRHSSTFNICFDVSIWVKMVDQPTDRPILAHLESRSLLDSGDLYSSMHPLRLAGLASVLCFMICAFMHAPPSVRRVPELNSILSVMLHSSKQMTSALHPVPYTLHFLRLCFMLRSFLYPSVKDLVTEGRLAPCSHSILLPAPFSPIFFSAHPSLWSCNGFNICFFEVADRSYCVAVDVTCVLFFFFFFYCCNWASVGQYQPCCLSEIHRSPPPTEEPRGLTDHTGGFAQAAQ